MQIFLSTSMQRTKCKKKTIREVEKFKFTLETRGATETNYIKRVFKTRYFLKHPSEPRCKYTN